MCPYSVDKTPICVDPSSEYTEIWRDGVCACPLPSFGNCSTDERSTGSVIRSALRM